MDLIDSSFECDICEVNGNVPALRGRDVFGEVVWFDISECEISVKSESVGLIAGDVLQDYQDGGCGCWSCGDTESDLEVAFPCLSNLEECRGFCIHVVFPFCDVDLLTE